MGVRRRKKNDEVGKFKYNIVDNCKNLYVTQYTST
jgi:hypothetical protein